MFAQSQVTCNDCGGRGTVIKKICPHCKGHKVNDHTAEFTLEVTPGMPEGHEVIFEGEADESPDWEAGDVIVRVRSKKDVGGWRRKETNLYWKETIGVDQVRSCSVSFVRSKQNGRDKALLGFEKNITLLDGRNFLLDRKGVTQPGKVAILHRMIPTTSSLGFVQVIKGEGMPHFGSRSTKGDLFVEYNVVLPSEISPETRRSKSLDPSGADWVRVADIDGLELLEAFHLPSSTHDEL